MGFRKIRRDPADALFSLFIRWRDGWTCQKCGKKFEAGAQNLHCSHFWGRGRENTRFDPENADAICSFDHEAFGKDPALYCEWKIQRIGEEAYNKLRIRAEMRCKRDRKAQVIYWRARLKQDFGVNGK